MATPKKNKIIVILGPTASGKSALAVKFAKKFNGEVISADSRQVYKGLNIGTGKITKEEMLNIPHHMLDVLSPKKVFTAAEFKNKTDKIIQDILSRDKVPILCGGTGFYIQAIVDNVEFPNVLPNPVLRKKLSPLGVETLFAKLKKLDSERAKTSDRYNKVRLIRAIEIATVLGKVPKVISNPQFETLQIGIKTDEKELKKKIHARLVTRLQQGMITEVRNLHKNGLSWKRLHELGLEYRYISNYLQSKSSKDEMFKKLETAIWHFARRQMTWFKRDKRIKWFIISERKQLEKEIKKFLN